MKSFYEFCTILEATAPANPQQELYNKISTEINQGIDNWVNDTITALQNKTKEFKQPSLWNRIKGGVQNMFYGAFGQGRNDPKNPMVNKNAYGHGWGEDLDKKECVEKLEALFESAQKEIDELFFTINEAAPAPAGAAPAPAGGSGGARPNLQIFKFIQDQANELKASVKKILDDAFQLPAPAAAAPPTT